MTNPSDPPEVIWRDYNQRADLEKRIGELKYGLTADDFCLREFFATEPAFLSIPLLFNLLSEFQHVSGIQGYSQPATLRAPVLLRGAILGRAGHKPVLHMSPAWGGLGKRNSILDNILAHVFPTSWKLDFQQQKT